MPLNIAKKLLTIKGIATIQELKGIPYIDKVTRIKSVTITTSRQFSKLLYNLETIECALTQYTELAVKKLRAQKCICGFIHVFLSTCNYAYEKDPDKCYSDGITIQLKRPTSYTPDILESALVGLKKIFRQGYGFKTVMITLLDIQPDNGQDLLWINPNEDIKKKHFMNTVDSLTNEYNGNIIFIAKSLTASGWENKRNMLSPCWTTKIKDCPKVY